MMIDSLVLRLATVSLPPVRVSLLPFTILETKGRARGLLCILHSNIGRRPSPFKPRRGGRIANVLFRPSIAARVVVRVNFSPNLTIYSN
jgi:hypothetical protein